MILFALQIVQKTILDIILVDTCSPYQQTCLVAIVAGVNNLTLLLPIVQAYTVSLSHQHTANEHSENLVVLNSLIMQYHISELRNRQEQTVHSEKRAKFHINFLALFDSMYPFLIPWF